jgi:hypothetical protein
MGAANVSVGSIAAENGLPSPGPLYLDSGLNGRNADPKLFDRLAGAGAKLRRHDEPIARVHGRLIRNSKLIVVRLANQTGFSPLRMRVA